MKAPENKQVQVIQGEYKTLHNEIYCFHQLKLVL